MPTTRSPSSPSALSAATPRRFRPLKRAGRFSPLPHSAEARFRTRTRCRTGARARGIHGPDGKRPFLSRGGGVFALARPWSAESRAGSKWGPAGLREGRFCTLQTGTSRPARCARVRPPRCGVERLLPSEREGRNRTRTRETFPGRRGGIGNGRARRAGGPYSHSHAGDDAEIRACGIGKGRLRGAGGGRVHSACGGAGGGRGRTGPGGAGGAGGVRRSWRGGRRRRGSRRCRRAG